MIKESDWTRVSCPVTCKPGFLRYWVCKGKWRKIKSFILDYFQQKVVTKFSKNSKTPVFWHILAQKLMSRFRKKRSGRTNKLEFKGTCNNDGVQLPVKHA